MPNPVVHFQILAKNPAETSLFYGQLFDWQVNADNPLGYREFDTGSEEGIQGGVWPAPPEAKSFVQIHVQVDDVETMCRRATELGGSLVIPPQELPRGERMAVACDPEGVPFVMIEMPRD